MAPIELKIGLDSINSYKRLAYTPWHAIAEFVDNATQSYFDNRAELDDQYALASETGLEVRITYDRNESGGFLRISDNAMGMDEDELRRSMIVAHRPPNPTGRSRYGMGLKTSACWIGNKWTIRTKKLGETTEHQVTVDVPSVASGENDLNYRSRNDQPPETHYTVIEVTQHNRQFHGRTLGKIRDFLRSMYRQDFRNEDLLLYWQHEKLEWQEPDMLRAKDGSVYRKDFRFEVDGRSVWGWVGILARGSRADAGFSIIHSGRVVRGWPDSWRPSTLYGQLQGTNDLVNQRLVGEIHLDEFEISHTKDDILWLGSQEEDVEQALFEHCGDFREAAKDYRKTKEDERGPSNPDVDVAVDEVARELQSPEMVDKIMLTTVTPPEAIAFAKSKIVNDVTTQRSETLKATVGELLIKLFLAPELSFHDPYVESESTKDQEVIVIVNLAHPHWKQLKGSEGVANYLRHCIYDAIAEWQARQKASQLDPDTVKILKDRLLRVSFEVENHESRNIVGNQFLSHE